MDQPSDLDLVRSTRRGETETFGLLVNRYQQKVYNVCYRMLGERRDAEDLTQETFLRAYQRLGSFDVQRPFGPWIAKVAANLCLNQLKKKVPEAMALDEERDSKKDDRASNPEEKHAVAAQANMIRSAILALPPHYRAVVELRHFQGMSYKDISAELAIPLSNVKSHLFRARKQLAEELSGL